MAAAFDYLLSEKGDLIISNDDFQIGNSDEQHIQDTIISNAGWWKENITDGVAISNYLNSSGNLQDLQRVIKIQLQIDGYTVNNPTVSILGTSVKINPNATRN